MNRRGDDPAGRGAGGCAQAGPITFSLNATALDVRRTVGALMAWLRLRLRVGGAAFSAVEIAVTEALNNVVEHGFRGAPGDIALRAVCDASRITVEIVDTGIPCPASVIAPPARHDLAGPVDRLPEGGFGWRMIHDLASSVQYDRRGATNHLILVFDRSGILPSA